MTKSFMAGLFDAGQGDTAFEDSLNILTNHNDSAKLGLKDHIEDLVNGASLYINDKGASDAEYNKMVISNKIGANFLNAVANGMAITHPDKVDDSVVSETQEFIKKATRGKISSPILSILSTLGFGNDLFPDAVIGNNNSVFQSIRNANFYFEGNPEFMGENSKNYNLAELLYYETEAYDPSLELEKDVSNMKKVREQIDSKPEPLMSNEMAKVAMNSTDEILNTTSEFKKFRNSVTSKTMLPLLEKRDFNGKFDNEKAIEYLKTLSPRVITKELIKEFETGLPEDKSTKDAISKSISAANKSILEVGGDQITTLNGLFDFSDIKTANIKFSKLYGIIDVVSGPKKLKDILHLYKETLSIKELCDGVDGAFPSDETIEEFIRLKNSVNSIQSPDIISNLSLAFINSLGCVFNESIISRHEYANGMFGGLGMSEYALMEGLMPNISKAAFDFEHMNSIASVLLRDMSAVYIWHSIKNMNSTKANKVLSYLWQ